MRHTFYTCIFIVIAAIALTDKVAAQESDWSLFLLPIVMDPGETVQGAQGSEWSGELWYHNLSGAAFSLQGLCEFTPCASIRSPALEVVDAVRKHSVDSGALISIPSETKDDIFFANRIFESAGGAQPLGVEIPVVREEDFLTKVTELIGIPVDPSNRMTLRVYDPRRMPGSSVLVEILAPTAEVIASATLSPGNFGPMSVNPFFPGYDAIFDLAATLPEIAEYETIHVRVTPLSEGMEFWTFLSITDNETQHVALYTPQQ